MIGADKVYKIGLFLFLSLYTVWCLNRGLNIFIFSHSELLQGNFYPYTVCHSFIVFNSQLSPLPFTLGIEAELSSPHSQLCLNLNFEHNSGSLNHYHHHGVRFPWLNPWVRIVGNPTIRVAMISVCLYHPTFVHQQPLNQPSIEYQYYTSCYCETALKKTPTTILSTCPSLTPGYPPPSASYPPI